jgi:hypothetical protein
MKLRGWLLSIPASIYLLLLSFIPWTNFTEDINNSTFFYQDGSSCFVSPIFDRQRIVNYQLGVTHLMCVVTTKYCA